MRVFVTGATGFVGSAVVSELLQAGYRVLGLARTDTAAASLAAGGADVLRGVLEEGDVLRAGAESCDAVVHTAFNHDFSNFAAGCETDRKAIEIMGNALSGSDRPLLITSGLAVLSSGPVSMEPDPAIPASPDYPRASEAAANRLAAAGVNARVVRLPFSVHGAGDHGFVPMLIDLARRKGVSAMVGDGANRWPAVHREDAARLYRLALEAPEASGPFHAVGEEGVAFADIAAMVGRKLDVPLQSLSPLEAAKHFGFLGAFAGMDAPASSERTRSQLGWEPSRPGLLTDMDKAGYFGN